MDNESETEAFTKIFILVRPENIEIFNKENDKKFDDIFNAVVNTYIFLGSNIKYEVTDNSGFRINAIKKFEKGAKIFNPGEKVKIGWNNEDIILIKE